LVIFVARAGKPLWDIALFPFSSIHSQIYPQILGETLKNIVATSTCRKFREMTGEERANWTICYARCKRLSSAVFSPFTPLNGLTNRVFVARFSFLNRAWGVWFMHTPAGKSREFFLFPSLTLWIFINPMIFKGFPIGMGFGKTSGFPASERIFPAFSALYPQSCPQLWRGL